MNSIPADAPEITVKTVIYRKKGREGSTGRVSVRTLKEMIARWEIGPDDLIQIEGDTAERKVREYPALSPLDEMLLDVSRKLVDIKKAQGRRAEAIRALELLLEYAERTDRVYSVACFYLGWLRYVENPALAKGLFLKAIERGYPIPSIARNNLAVSQIRLGDPAGRDNLILAANDPQRPVAALTNLALLLQHLQGLGEKTEEIANVKDLWRVARAEWHKGSPAPGEPAAFALFLCDGDIPASFSSEVRTAAKIQAQIEDILAEGEDCLRQGRLEQALAHAARAASEIERAREQLSSGTPQRGAGPLRFLSVRLSRLEKESMAARATRENQGQLEIFRKRLKAMEESLQLRVPPSDLIQQAEILLDSARTDGEKSEAAGVLRECQDRMARHLLVTAGELLATGEKEVALGLLRRALTFDSRVSDEIKLRIASVRRDELEEEIARSAASRNFEEARAKIALLRTIHPIFEPVSRRLEVEVNAQEAGALVERVVALLGAKSPTKETALEARRLFEQARALHGKPATLEPIDAQLQRTERNFGIPGTSIELSRDPPLTEKVRGDSVSGPSGTDSADGPEKADGHFTIVSP
jgi:tetratricopeptide (TPR) repeat protein